MSRLLVVIVLLASSSACNRKPAGEAACGAVGNRLFTLATDDLAKATVEPSMRRMVADQLPAMRDALTAACADGAWSAAARNCMAAAADHAAFQTCQQQLTDPQRHALELRRGPASGGTTNQ
jgi:hypothetical protein